MIKLTISVNWRIKQNAIAHLRSFLSSSSATAPVTKCFCHFMKRMILICICYHIRVRMMGEKARVWTETKMSSLNDSSMGYMCKTSVYYLHSMDYLFLWLFPFLAVISRTAGGSCSVNDGELLLKSFLTRLPIDDDVMATVHRAVVADSDRSVYQPDLFHRISISFMCYLGKYLMS